MIPHIFRPLALAIALFAAACATQAPTVSNEAPPLDNGVYVANGICFGEWGCDFAHWRAAAAIALHERPDPASPIVARVALGDWVTPLEGQWRLPPVRGIVRAPFQSQDIQLTPGDVVYRLEPEGEGYHVFWLRGQRYTSQWIESEPDEPITFDAAQAPLPAGAITGLWRRFQLENGQTGWAEDGPFECMSERSGDEGCRG